jgi:hypothetical protein
VETQTVIGVLNVLVPVLTPIVATGVIAVRERRARRSSAGRRKLILEDARAQVELADLWFKAQQDMDGSHRPGAPPGRDAADRAQEWLDRVSAAVAENPLLVPRQEPAMTFRRLALLDGISTTAGKAVRVVFYAFCGLTVTVVGATIGQMISPEQANTDVYGLKVSSFVGAGVVVAPITVLLRFVTVAVDRAAARPDVTGRQTHGFLREVLLLRELIGRGAGTLRVLFHLGLLGVTAYLSFYAYYATVHTDLLWLLLPITGAGTTVYVTATFGVRAWAVSIDREARLAAARAAADEALPDRKAALAPGPPRTPVA